MDKSTHTPGPWRTGKACGAVVADSAEGIRIRGAVDADSVEYYGGNLIGESISPNNIPLIAAAPELLEALKNVVMRFEWAAEVAEQVSTHLHDLPELQEQLDDISGCSYASDDINAAKELIAYVERK